jgi:glycosyltransferase involved in cell wall biosynthesis
VVKPFLSIILPAYNEEARLPDALDKIFGFLQKQSFQSEVIIVENASTDQTLQIARASIDKYAGLRVFHQDEPGKGRAVKLGVLEAQGDFRFICDVDLSMPVDEISRFLPPHNDSNITIASREAKGAVRYHEPAYRHVVGRVFNWIVQVMALPGLQDSQCGFKCFSREAAESLFPLQTINGWTFDVEILFIARRKRIPIKEIPIPWYHNPNSKVRVVRDSIQMFLEILLIRWNSFRGRYGPRI